MQENEIDGLIATLRNSKSESARTNALTALMASEDERVLPALRDVLYQEVSSSRKRLWRNLVRFGGRLLLLIAIISVVDHLFPHGNYGWIGGAMGGFFLLRLDCRRREFPQKNGAGIEQI